MIFPHLEVAQVVGEIGQALPLGGEVALAIGLARLQEAVLLAYLQTLRQWQAVFRPLDLPQSIRLTGADLVAHPNLPPAREGVVGDLRVEESFVVQSFEKGQATALDPVGLIEHRRASYFGL